VRRANMHRFGEESSRDNLAQRGRRRISLFAAGLLLALLASCATIPEKSAPQWLGVLPDDGTLYVSLSVQSSLSTIKKALTQAGPAYNDVASLLDMTKKLYIAITLVPGEAPRFSAVALGSYPTFLLGLRLGSSAEWKSRSSQAGSWYQSAKGGLELGVPAGSVILFSNGNMGPLFSRLRQSAALSLPADVVRDMGKSDLVLYLPELPGGITEKAVGSVHIPIHETWLDARKDKNGYQVGGTVNLSTEKEARLLAMVMKLALVAWLRSQAIADVAERLDAISITPAGNQVVLTGLSFSEDEMVPLFMSLITGAVPVGAEKK
jgi:hypothetical protein